MEDSMPEAIGFPLTEIKGNPDRYDLRRSKLHLKFSLQRKPEDRRKK